MGKLTYREKNIIAKQMANDSFVEADKNLLETKSPKHSLLHRTLTMPSGSTLSYELVYVLLDFFTPAEISGNRGYKAPSKKKLADPKPKKPAKSKEQVKKQPEKPEPKKPGKTKTPAKKASTKNTR